MERCEKETALFRSDYKKEDELSDRNIDVEGENAISSDDGGGGGSIGSASSYMQRRIEESI